MKRRTFSVSVLPFRRPHGSEFQTDVPGRIPVAFTGLLLCEALLCTTSLPAQDLFQEAVVLESPRLQTNGYFGAEGVTSVPDVNRDGIDDIVVAAWFEDPPGGPNNAGRVYVFDGKTREVLMQLRDPNQSGRRFGSAITGIGDLNGNHSGEIVVATGDPDRTIVFDGGTGAVIHTFSLSARRLASVGDLSGDGLPEILVGVPGSNSAPGTVRIYDGATGALLDTLSSPDNNVASNRFGGGITSVPDLTGDGHPDLVVGDRRYQSEAGRAYVFDGVSRDLVYPVPAPAGSPGQFARSVAGLNDVNNDGKSDFLVGCVGAAYVIDGADGSVHHELVPNTPTDSFGWSIAAVPDTTGDGIMDVVVGSFVANPGHDVEVFNGATGSYMTSLGPHSDFGGDQSLSGLRDVNGDGLGEILVGSPYSDSSTGLVDAGQVRLFRSSPPPPPPALRALGFVGETFRLEFTGQAGQVIDVKASESMETWVSLGQIILTGGPDPFPDPEAKTEGRTRRFYRGEVVPPSP